jgi:hypothetical protein
MDGQHAVEGRVLGLAIDESVLDEAWRGACEKCPAPECRD